jgi:DNA-directed RNA polymerase specialized sigma24 family protein
MLQYKNDIIAQWVNDYGHEMYQYACTKISNCKTAKDIVQNTFLAALHSYASFEGKTESTNYLRCPTGCISTNACPVTAT